MRNESCVAGGRLHFWLIFGDAGLPVPPISEASSRSFLNYAAAESLGHHVSTLSRGDKRRVYRRLLVYGTPAA
jgi:hypothetical protein